MKQVPSYLPSTSIILNSRQRGRGHSPRESPGWSFYPKLFFSWAVETMMLSHKNSVSHIHKEGTGDDLKDLFLLWHGRKPRSSLLVSWSGKQPAIPHGLLLNCIASVWSSTKGNTALPALMELQAGFPWLHTPWEFLPTWDGLSIPGHLTVFLPW